MKKLVTVVWSITLVLLVCEVSQCQQWQYSFRDQTAGLPPGSVADVVVRNWRSQNFRPDRSDRSIAQSFSHTGSWTAPPEPQMVSSQNVDAPQSIPKLVGTNGYNDEMIAGAIVSPETDPSSYMNVGGNRPGSYDTGSWQQGWYSPYVMGDIFDVGRNDYCDEWANHCPCLELTNARSNCECTNPYRTRQAPCRHGYRINQATCDGCNRSGDDFRDGNAVESSCSSCARSTTRSTVSEYFHPERYR